MSCHSAGYDGGYGVNSSDAAKTRGHGARGRGRGRRRLPPSASHGREPRGTLHLSPPLPPMTLPRLATTSTATDTPNRNDARWCPPPTRPPPTMPTTLHASQPPAQRRRSPPVSFGAPPEPRTDVNINAPPLWSTPPGRAFPLRSTPPGRGDAGDSGSSSNSNSQSPRADGSKWEDKSSSLPYNSNGVVSWM